MPREGWVRVYPDKRKRGSRGYKSPKLKGKKGGRGSYVIPNGRNQKKAVM